MCFKLNREISLKTGHETYAVNIRPSGKEVQMRMTVFLTIMMLILGACGGDAAPTSAPTAQTSVDPTAAPTTEAVVPTQPPSGSPVVMERTLVYETGQPTLSAPGTLVAAATPDPDVGLIFDLIQFEQTGGITGETVTIELRGDGTLVRNGVTGTISQDQVAFIDNMLDQMNFFGITGVFTAPGRGADLLYYTLTVERAGTSVTLRAQDGLIPPELGQLLTLIGSLGA
jgi:hypothetical protein